MNNKVVNKSAALTYFQSKWKTYECCICNRKYRSEGDFTTIEIGNRVCCICLRVIEKEVVEMNENGIDIDILEHTANKLLMELLTNEPE